MSKYPVHTVESAPEKSKPALQGLQKNLGLIPNLAATMATSPTRVNGFVAAFGNFHGGSFSGAEKQVLLLTNAIANRSEWAAAFHSTMALEEGVALSEVQAIRQGRSPKDGRLAALVEFDRALIEQRGAVATSHVVALREAGFGEDQVLEVIAGLAVSVMANYAGNITPRDIAGVAVTPGPHLALRAQSDSTKEPSWQNRIASGQFCLTAS